MAQATEVPTGTTASEDISREELQLAARNHGMPLEALRHDRTPLGLHYLLIHYDIPAVDPQKWRLVVDGAVGTPLELSLDDLQARPTVTQPVIMECAGNGRTRLRPRAVSQPWVHEAVGNAEWTGVPLASLLDEARPAADAVEFVFTGLDRGVEGEVLQDYARSLPVADARRPEVMLAHGVNGRPLPPQHGFPLRLLVPGWYGMASVKWLTRVTAVTEPFQGYQMVRAYRYRRHPDDVGEPVSRIAVRSLIAPPGIPEFLTRRRVVPPGPCALSGRAWSGHGRIVRVEVSDDAGRSWADAQVDPAPGPHAWHAWSFAWKPAGPGSYELCSRATDAAGNIQPLEPGWNLGGYAVNAVHRVPVEVTVQVADDDPGLTGDHHR